MCCVCDIGWEFLPSRAITALSPRETADFAIVSVNSVICKLLSVYFCV